MLHSGTILASVQIEYFAILRERAGCAREQVDSGATTLAELFQELTARHAFPQLASVKVAVNDEFAEWQRPLRDGDRIVFIPPVAGG
jgi:molybdopterin converting factor subunit 1